MISRKMVGDGRLGGRTLRGRWLTVAGLVLAAAGVARGGAGTSTPPSASAASRRRRHNPTPGRASYRRTGTWSWPDRTRRWSLDGSTPTARWTRRTAARASPGSSSSRPTPGSSAWTPPWTGAGDGPGGTRGRHDHHLGQEAHHDHRVARRGRAPERRRERRRGVRDGREIDVRRSQRQGLRGQGRPRATRREDRDRRRVQPPRQQQAEQHDVSGRPVRRALDRDRHSGRRLRLGRDHGPRRHEQDGFMYPGRSRGSPTARSSSARKPAARSAAPRTHGAGRSAASTRTAPSTPRSVRSGRRDGISSGSPWTATTASWESASRRTRRAG